MDSKDFVLKLNKAQDLMAEENYEDAISILDNLKEIEKEGEFDYSLTHKLYQLISNSKSLLNQKIILKKINEQKKSDLSININTLFELIKDELKISKDILKREIELLILRGLLICRIDSNNLIF